MQFRVAADATGEDATATLTELLEREDDLRPLPDWVATASATPSFDWEITVSTGGLRPRWLLNGESYNPARSQVTAEVGEVVTWKLHNRTQVGHLLHLHHTDWYMLRRNGAEPPPHERCLKETFFLDPFESVVVAGKMSDYTGKYVVHCHMLEHEDHGLMSQFEVVPPAP
jgi:FtsP/CotA-like multicopper oxidase with cupredoxin domain